MNKVKLASLLGFAMKSGNLKTGTENVVKSIVSGRAKIVILATNAAENSTKKITDKSMYYGVNLYRVFTIDELSKIIGKSNRVAVAVTDLGFASSMEKIITE